MKKILLLSALLLMGCNSVSPTLISNHAVVITPDESMYNCPLLKKFPKTETLTDIQVAKVMVELYKDNRMCKTSMNAIHKFLDDAKAKIKSQK